MNKQKPEAPGLRSAIIFSEEDLGAKAGGYLSNMAVDFLNFLALLYNYYLDKED